MHSLLVLDRNSIMWPGSIRRVCCSGHVNSAPSLPRVRTVCLLCCCRFRRSQRRTWLYRIRPSVTHEPFHPLNFPAETLTADFAHAVRTPNQIRWRPFPVPTEPVDFVRGLFTVCGAGRCDMLRITSRTNDRHSLTRHIQDTPCWKLLYQQTQSASLRDG